MSVASHRPRPGPRERLWAIGLTGSLVFHAAVLVLMGLGLFQKPVPLPTFDDPLPVFVEMEPRPLLAGETARVPAPSAQARPQSNPTLGEIATGAPTPDPRRDEDEDDDRPAPPAPRAATTAPGAPAPPPGAWQVTPEGMAAAVGRSMRTGAGGCRIMDGRLNPGEQALCDERFNEAAGRAGPLGPRTLNASEARREAAFAREGARALAQYEVRRRPLSGGVGIVGPGDCPGSNLGAGCAGAHLDPAIRQGATTVGNPGLGSNDPAPMRPIPGQE